MASVLVRETWWSSNTRARLRGCDLGQGVWFGIGLMSCVWARQNYKVLSVCGPSDRVRDHGVHVHLELTAFHL